MSEQDSNSQIRKFFETGLGVKNFGGCGWLESDIVTPGTWAQFFVKCGGQLGVKPT